MAKKDKKTEGQKFVESLLEHVPADVRETVKAGLMVDGVLDFAGENTLRQSEFSRAMDEVRAVQERAAADEARYNKAYGENVVWKATNDAILDKVNKLKEKGVDLDSLIAGGGHSNGSDDASRIDAAQFVKKNELSQLAQLEAQKLIGQREGQFVGFATTLQDLSNKHYHNYKEPLDTTTLVREAQKRNQPLDVVYADMTSDLAEQRSKADKKRAEEDLEKVIQRRVQEAISKRSPYPTDGGDEPSTLAGLAGKKDGVGSEAAVAAFYALQNK